jgi:hypothetical protein
MKILPYLLMLLSFSSFAELRVCEKQESYPSKSENPELSQGEYEYEKHIYELAYDEIEDIKYKNYQDAMVYFDSKLPPKIKEKYNIFHYSESAGTYRYYVSAINSYVLRLRAHNEFIETGKKGEAVEEFCEYLSKQFYHP